MDKKKRVLNILQVVVFLLILAAGTGAVVFGACEGKTFSELEKRELTAFPEVKTADVFNGKFESDFDEALSDHFYGRDTFVTMKTWMEILLGKREIDGIYIDGEQLIETYKDSDFEDKQIKENISYLTDFMASVAGGVGAEHVKLALVPSKCTVYRDHLPGYMPTSKRADTIADEVRESLAEKLASGTDESASEDEDTSDDDEEIDEEGFDFGDDEEVDEEGFDFGDDEEEDSSEDSDESVFDDEDSDEDVFDDGFNFEEGDPDAEEGDTATDEPADGNQEKDGTDTGDVTDDGTGTTETGEQPVSADNAQQMKEKAEGMVIDLRPTLKAHVDEYIYYRTDHHWTTLGALYAYQAMMNPTGPDISKYKTETIEEGFLGTDYNRIHYYKNADTITHYVIPEADSAEMEINDSGDISQKQSIYEKNALQTADKYNYFFSGNYSAITIKTGAQNDKTLLIVKDSFTNSLAPFLCENYKTIILVDLRYVNSSIYDYLPKEGKLDDVWIVCNEEKFMQDTHQMYLQ